MRHIFLVIFVAWCPGFIAEQDYWHLLSTSNLHCPFLYEECQVFGRQFKLSPSLISPCSDTRRYSQKRDSSTNGGIRPIAISTVCIVCGFPEPSWSTRSSTTGIGIYTEQIYSFYPHMGLSAFNLSTTVFAILLDASQIFKMLIIPSL